MKINILVALIILPFWVSGQHFEGKIRYTTYFLDKGANTNTLSIDPVSETVFIKGSKYKIKIDSAEQGMLDWEILDYNTKIGYYRQSYSNSTVPVYSEGPKIDSNGKISFGNPIENPIAPIIKFNICKPSNETMYKIIGHDTIIIDKGIRNKVLAVMHNEKRIMEIWYAIDYTIDPIQYSCDSTELANLVYKFTNGKIISKRFDFSDEAFDTLYELDEIKKEKIPDSEFILPKDIEVIDQKN